MACTWSQNTNRAHTVAVCAAVRVARAHARAQRCAPALVARAYARTQRCAYARAHRCAPVLVARGRLLQCERNVTLQRLRGQARAQCRACAHTSAARVAAVLAQLCLNLNYLQEIQQVAVIICAQPADYGFRASHPIRRTDGES